MVRKFAADVFGIERLPSANGQREDVKSLGMMSGVILSRLKRAAPCMVATYATRFFA